MSAARGDRRVRRGAFPDALSVEHLELPLDYQYEPGSPQDGVTLQVPIEALNQVAPSPWGGSCRA